MTPAAGARGARAGDVRGDTAIESFGADPLRIAVVAPVAQSIPPVRSG
jgi:hypothetical protein